MMVSVQFRRTRSYTKGISKERANTREPWDDFQGIRSARWFITTPDEGLNPPTEP